MSKCDNRMSDLKHYLEIVQRNELIVVHSDHSEHLKYAQICNLNSHVQMSRICITILFDKYYNNITSTDTRHFQRMLPTISTDVVIDS